ncbi:MAG: recombinase family protein [Steroidobacteraceae bacterium]
MSEKIRPHHLERKAILYIRQSSAYQVLHNLESQKLQYAMQEHLRRLGWQEIEIIDEDLGRSAAGTATRVGFERMVAQVCLGQVGAVAAREVSRFARNSREWQQLVEVCRVVDTVLIDQETVYAPRQSNDRLLLGLKGSLNEYELDLLRQRSLEARHEMAKRGELIVTAPVGYIKSEEPAFEKTPDRRVRQAIELLFEKVVEIGSVRQTLLWFQEHGLEFPAHTARSEVQWKRPSYGCFYRLLTNPIYGGAYAYGKSGPAAHCDGRLPRPGYRRKPREQWLSFIPNAHEGYVTWERFEQIQQLIKNNLLGREQLGSARCGAALLAGLLRCRRCGHKLTVRYTGSHHDVLRYSCWRGFLDNGEPRCIAFGGIPADEAIGREVLRVVQPAAIEAAVLASEDQAQKRDQVVAALQRDLEAAQYAARRAQKQFDAADPENRLVTDELERRWNQALHNVQSVQEQLDQHLRHTEQVVVPSRDEFLQLATQLESLWPDADPRLRKRIVRALIQEVIVNVDDVTAEVVLVIHWKGGVHNELRFPRRRRGQNNAHSSPQVLDAVRLLANICTDDLIASALNRSALPTGRGNRWSRERITSLRTHHKIACFNKERSSIEGWMNQTQAAAFLDISAGALRLAVSRGEIQAQHPLPDGPWVFNRRDLQTSAARELVQRIKNGRPDPTARCSNQVSLDFSST